MKKLLTVSLLGVLLSIPSVVFAQEVVEEEAVEAVEAVEAMEEAAEVVVEGEAEEGEAEEEAAEVAQGPILYGSIRTGIESAPIDTAAAGAATVDYKQKTGVADFYSRWGIQGSSEVSEGLTAVYKYETAIDSSSAGAGAGRLSYVGLSGGFGTITVGHLWNAAYSHFGGIVDQALNYGSTGFIEGHAAGAGGRVSNAVSYAVSVGNVSMQADAIMDQSEGNTGDGFNFGATLDGLMETGSIAIAHRKVPDGVDKETDEPTSETSSFIAGNYGIGDMTVFLGYNQSSRDITDCNVAPDDVAGGCVGGRDSKITYAGIHGGVGDTGVNYVFTMRNEKGSTTTLTDSDGDSGEVSTEATKTTAKQNPWTLGLSRSLGGGATLLFEHSDPDSEIDGLDSTTAVWLQIDF